jgi:hypothetical protein
MSAASESSCGPTGGERAARLGEVWEAANALAAVQMPKDHLGGGIKRSDVSLGSDNAIDGSSLVPLHNRRLVDPVVAPTPPFHRRVVACLCLFIVILTGGTSAVIVFRQLPLAYSWLDHVSSWVQFDRSTPPTARQDAFPRLRVETSRGLSGEPLQLRLAIDGPAEGSVVIITGMLAGMDISTGNEIGPDSWQLHSEDVPYAFVAPPEKFVGSVGLVAELRLANDKIADRQPVYLEWAPPSPLGPAENQYNREEPAGPNRRVEDDSDREKAAVSSSTPSAPAGARREALMSSSTSPVESDPDRRKWARLSRVSSSAAGGIARQEATATSTRPAGSDRETMTAISSSPPPAPEWQEPTASSTTRVAASTDRKKTAGMSNSMPATPGPQEVRSSSSLPVASDPNTKKSAVVPNSPSLAQNQGGREAAMVPPSLSRNTQKQVDQSQPVTEPSLPAFAQRQLDTDEVTVLLKRGKDLIAYGDFAGARVTLKRAAEANNAEAALALASTYDPFVLRELKVYGFSGDTAMARAWYEKAKELGSAVAPRRLEMLAREKR